MVTTWALDCVCRLKWGGKHSYNKPLSPHWSGLGVWGNKTRNAIFNRYFETVPQLAGIIAVLLTVSQPHRSAVHTRSSPGSPVVARPVNYFLTIISAGGPSCCTAFGIHGVLYFIQTLEAMFAASVTAKNVAFFSPKTLQLRG